MNKSDRLLKYSDVVLVPKLSNIESRGTIERKLQIWKSVIQFTGLQI